MWANFFPLLEGLSHLDLVGTTIPWSEALASIAWTALGQRDTIQQWYFLLQCSNRTFFCTCLLYSVQWHRVFTVQTMQCYAEFSLLRIALQRHQHFLVRVSESWHSCPNWCFLIKTLEGSICWIKQLLSLDFCRFCFWEEGDQLFYWVSAVFTQMRTNEQKKETSVIKHQTISGYS